jgi:hypothetical protein
MMTSRRWMAAGIVVALVLAAFGVLLAHQLRSEPPEPQVVNLGHICGKNNPSVQVTIAPGDDSPDRLNVLC